MPDVGDLDVGVGDQANGVGDQAGKWRKLFNNLKKLVEFKKVGYFHILTIGMPPAADAAPVVMTEERIAKYRSRREMAIRVMIALLVMAWALLLGFQDCSLCKAITFDLPPLIAVVFAVHFVALAFIVTYAIRFNIQVRLSERAKVICMSICAIAATFGDAGFKDWASFGVSLCLGLTSMPLCVMFSAFGLYETFTKYCVDVLKVKKAGFGITVFITAAALAKFEMNILTGDGDIPE